VFASTSFPTTDIIDHQSASFTQHPPSYNPKWDDDDDDDDDDDHDDHDDHEILMTWMVVVVVVVMEGMMQELQGVPHIYCNDKQDKKSVDDRPYGCRERADDILERLDPAEEPHHSEKETEINRDCDWISIRKTVYLTKRLTWRLSLGGGC
jgi:hypothetical protein